MSRLPIDLDKARATLGNPLWRLNNLYSITDKQGRVIPFRPNHVQRVLLADLYERHERRLLVLKSRKHGVSTLFDLVLLDACFFGENLQASILDLTAPDAETKLKKIVRNGWEYLPRDIRTPLAIDNNGMLEFDNRSTINAGKGARGGQNQLLHISEWGPIAFQDPERSTEIKTGALPSADEGVQLIESTFMGGKGGDFYELIKRTQETPEAERTPKDFRFRFFAWFEDDRNVLDGDLAWLPREMVAYLDELEAALRIKLTPGQRLWYWKTSLEQGIFMRREYPSTVDEAFAAPVEGAIYGKIMSQLRSAGHITRCTGDPGCPCFATWDLGWDDSLSVWIAQMIGRDVVWVWHRTARHETMAEMQQAIDKSAIPVMANLLPHDASHGNVVTGRVTPAEALKAAGGLGVIVVPRTRNVWAGIDLTRNLLARSWFDAQACQYGIEALEAYHKEEGKDDPVHDWSSHPSDAVRIAAEALEMGLLKPELAKRVINAPRAPNGDVLVDFDSRRTPLRRGSMLAKSGVTL